MKNISIMKPCSSAFSDDDWIRTMKKELFEGVKVKETLYNFSFTEDAEKSGRFSWEKIDELDFTAEPKTN